MDFQNKKYEMPRELRNLDYIYIDVEISFKKIQGYLQNEETEQLNNLYQKGMKKMVELAKTRLGKRFNKIAHIATGAAGVAG